MRHAQLASGKLVEADPDSPEEARCPACQAAVVLRRRRNGRLITYYYRHRNGAGPDDCPLRYQPGD